MDERNQPVIGSLVEATSAISSHPARSLKKRSQQKFHTKIVTIRVLDRKFLTAELIKHHKR